MKVISQAISELTNQRISHQGVWDVVQAAGERQTEAEQNLVKAFANNQLAGEWEVPVLFEEADGLWLSIQGKNRKGSSQGKKELKIGVIYEGWAQRYASSKEYRTVGKTAFAGYLKAEEFKDLREAKVAEKYNTDIYLTQTVWQSRGTASKKYDILGFTEKVAFKFNELILAFSCPQEKVTRMLRGLY